MENKISLGIESTAHTFGIGIIDSNKKIYANEKDSFITESGGLIPSELANHHFDKAIKVIKKALDKANLNIKDIDFISFSQGPGIGSALRIGSFVARYLSLKYNKPLIGVNHCIAHLEIGKAMTKSQDPVLLYVSGANTQVIAYDSGYYRIFGETLDMGVGNFLDSIAREFGFGFPGGPKLYELSLKSKNLIELPYVVKGMDISLGGIFTKVKQLYNKGYKIEDLAYSIQEYVFAMLLEVSERALAHCNKNELMLGGGVGCNKRLQEMAKIMCEQRDCKLYFPANSLMVDNGVMIAWLGLLRGLKNKFTSLEESSIRPYERTDDVVVDWL